MLCPDLPEVYVITSCHVQLWCIMSLMALTATYGDLYMLISTYNFLGIFLMRLRGYKANK